MTMEDSSLSGPYVSAEADGFSVSTNSGETAAEISENLTTPKEDEGGDDEEKVSKAAKELGKRGGKASAEARSSKDADQTGDRSEDGGDPANEDRDVADKPLGKPRNDPRARIAQINREKEEARAELERERQERYRVAQENDRLRREFEAARAPQPDPKPADGGPDKADFADYESYLDARAEWKADQLYKKRTQEAHREAEIDRYASQIAKSVEDDVSGFLGKIHPALQADPNAMSGIPDAMLEILVPSWMLEPGRPVSQVNVMADELLKLENPIAVSRALAAENGKEFQRIATLSSAPAITRALAKLDARFDVVTAGTNSKPKVSMAPNPVRPVTGGSAAVESDDEDLDLGDYIRKHNARDQQRRRASR